MHHSGQTVRENPAYEYHTFLNAANLHPETLGLMASLADRKEHLVLRNGIQSVYISYLLKMESRNQNLLMTYERQSTLFSRKSIVCHIIFRAEVILAEHTNEIKKSMEGKDFTPITSAQRLPDKFFSDFLERQGLRLKGAEEIKSLRKTSDGPGLDKAQLEGLYEGLQSGVVRFVLRSDGEE